MKIAMIGHKRIPSREGGIEVVVEELSTRLVQMGHSVTVYNRKESMYPIRMLTWKPTNLKITKVSE